MILYKNMMKIEIFFGVNLSVVTRNMLRRDRYGFSHLSYFVRGSIAMILIVKPGS